MRTLSWDQSEEWLKARGVKSFTRRDLLSAAGETRTVKGDSGWKTALARNLVHSFFSDGASLIFIPESGVFHSCEIPFLFEEFRSRHSFGGTVGEMPGTITSVDEIGYLTSLLALALYFSWDVLVVDENATCLFFATHDDEFTIKPLEEHLSQRVSTFLG